VLQSEAETPAADVDASSAGVPSGASLVVLQGFFEGLEVPIDRGRVVVGRGKGADLVLPEPTISRTHAAVGFDAETGAFFVQDLDSTNGTYVNGAQTARSPLKAGDEVQMGTLRRRLSVP